MLFLESCKFNYFPFLKSLQLRKLSLPHPPHFHSLSFTQFTLLLSEDSEEEREIEGGGKEIKKEREKEVFSS